MKILMVCLGNICRSPLAEGIMRKRAAEAGLDWEIDSAGTASYHAGEPPYYLSQEVAARNQLDISEQKCRKFLKEDMQRFDRIYVMDGDNYKEVKNISGALFDEKKVHWLLHELYPDRKEPVPDPYFGTAADFDKVFDLINRGCCSIIDNYKLSNG
ncbi:MAG: low molecular weight phosphotyrosine protein phosphatase [Chitinophagia bacterium]|nr:low molecular weight phosphotyrosine protein phosphatase [Chitinophagia bacterium]